jgi:hypothetical protein
MYWIISPKTPWEKYREICVDMPLKLLKNLVEKIRRK